MHLNVHKNILILLTFFIFFAFSQAKAAVLVKERMWRQSTTLNVIFLDGTQQQIGLVKKWAPLWIKNTKLAFRFFDITKPTPEISHIRVSFKSHTGAMLGDHNNYHANTPTLSLAELDPQILSPNYLKRLVLHEFGHALGFEHEYRNPKWPYGPGPIKTQIGNCYLKMRNIGHTTREATQKCNSINQPLSPTETYSTIFDEYSIMNYPQKILLEDGSTKHIRVNYSLSVLDKMAMQHWYNN